MIDTISETQNVYDTVHIHEKGIITSEYTVYTGSAIVYRS